MTETKQRERENSQINPSSAEFLLVYMSCLYGILTGCAQILEDLWQCELTKMKRSQDKFQTSYYCIFQNCCWKRTQQDLILMTLGKTQDNGLFTT